MQDIPKHIKELQLKIWLAKSSGERLHQMLLDNEEVFKFGEAVKQQQTTKSEKK